MIRKLVAILAVTVAAMGAGPTQTALQPAQVIPTGRVCIQKQFGAKPPAAPVLDPIWFTSPGIIAELNGMLYSTSPQGGKTGAGSVFEISPAGALRVVASFAPYDTSTGSGPTSGLVDGHDGYLYGTTYGGGKLGVGTLFRIKPSQTKPEILWSFRNGSTLGLRPTCPPKLSCYWPGPLKADIAAAYPTAPPVVGKGGVLYGVTSWSNNQGFGVLYKDAPPYDSTSFHALCIFDQRLLADTSVAKFVCKAPINYPLALLLDSAGTTLYGTTGGGPVASIHGTVFKASTSGDVSILHAFDLDHGSKPFNLMLASNGQLYGTTSNGGAAGVGTIYRLDTSGGGFTVMSSFRVNGWLQGANPYGGLAEIKPSGSVQPFLFGATKFGGRYGRGTLFRIPLQGDSLSLRVVHEFDMYFTGRSPVTGVMAARDGKIYGLTYQGGALDGGVLYALDPIVLNETTTKDAYLAGGLPAKDDAGTLIKDSVVQIFTDAQASQTGVDTAGKPVTKSIVGGIRVLGRCPNPHIVQFLYRERIASWGTVYHDTMATVSGTYPLSDVAANQIFWNTDVPFTTMVLGPFEQRNAYLDQANGAGHYSVPGAVEIFDKPAFGAFDDPARPSPVYLPYKQNVDVKLSETWRATARDFLVCNCQLAKEIWWSREIVANKASYKHIKVVTPAPGALAWINAQLKANGYAAIP
jgi:uncharacterized repeat protein (TIGR03803 family)